MGKDKIIQISEEQAFIIWNNPDCSWDNVLKILKGKGFIKQSALEEARELVNKYNDQGGISVSSIIDKYEQIS